MTATANCSFCVQTAGFGPFRGAHVCAACARRIGRMASLGEGPFRQLRGVGEPTPPEVADAELDTFKRDVEKLIPSELSEAHADLAVAYHEMGLHQDAVREAGLALSGAGSRAVTQVALKLLLSELLLGDGLAMLRARLLLS